MGERLTDKLWGKNKVPSTTCIKSSFRYNNYSTQQYVTNCQKSSKFETLLSSENTTPRINRRNLSLQQNKENRYPEKNLSQLKMSKSHPLSSISISNSFQSPLIRLGTIVRVKLRGNSKDADSNSKEADNSSINSLQEEQKLLDQKCKNNNFLILHNSKLQKYPKNLVTNSIEHL